MSWPITVTLPAVALLALPLVGCGDIRVRLGTQAAAEDALVTQDALRLVMLQRDVQQIRDMLVDARRGVITEPIFVK